MEPTKKNQLVEVVFPAELREIRRRRRILGVDLPPPGERPAEELGLTGLAFSGGGIRSASFCLGVVQRLAAVGGLRYVDYLSTVSGGGYVGCCISSLLGDPPEGWDPRKAPFPLAKVGAEEPPALVHLRNGSNYLSPPGTLDALRVPAIFLRGVVLSMFAVLPFVIAAVVVTRILYDWVFPHFESGGVDLDYLRTSTPLASTLAIFGLLSVSYPFVVGFFRARFDWRRRNGFELLIAAGLLLALVALVCWPLSSLIHYAVVSSPAQVSRNLSSESKSLADSYGLYVLGAVAVLAAASARSPAVAGVVKTIGSGMLGALGVMIPLVMYLCLCLYEISPQQTVPDADGTVVQALLRGEMPEALRPAMAEMSAVAGAAAEKVTPRLPGKSWEMHGPLGTFHVRRGPQGLVVLSENPDPGYRHILAAGILALLLNLRFLDVNIASPHSFFRDRLSKVFLLRLQGDGVAPNDALKLSALNAKENAAAPYHLVNATLNLGGSKDRDLRGRNADFFFFSKLFVGSERVGYAPTPDVEAADAHLDLGTAMAISAGAAAPQMGAIAEARGLSALLTLANVRMSYWLPNPLRDGQSSVRQRMHIGPGPGYLLQEAFGTASERRRFVNVSDGGHVENLGLYQLLRRRCRLIIAVDGEEDYDLHFGGLVTLLRYASIDMGVTIDIDLDPLRQSPDGTSARQWALGRIHYGQGDHGTLVYVKASIHGDEGEVIRDYRRRHPRFPHESTADQFFSEAQQEAYRALGEHIASQIWRGAVARAEDLAPAPLEAPRLPAGPVPTDDIRPERPASTEERVLG